MVNKQEIHETLNYLQSLSVQEVTFNEEAISKTLELHSGSGSSIAIKILSIAGGILSGAAFVGFLFLAGLHQSSIGMLIFGLIFIATGIVLSRGYGKTIVDTLSITLYIIGFVLIGFGLGEQRVDENTISLAFIILAIAAMLFSQNYVLAFVSVLIIFGSLFILLGVLRQSGTIILSLSIVALLLTFVYFAEANFIKSSKIVAKLHAPLKAGITVAFVAGLVICQNTVLFVSTPFYYYLLSVINIVAILFVISKVLPVLGFTSYVEQMVSYILIAATLALTIIAPEISGAMLVVFLGFYTNHKTGFVLGIAAFIYFISKFYYDLSFTLLTKSILMMASGVLFLVIYYFFNKKLKSNEKI